MTLLEICGVLFLIELVVLTFLFTAGYITVERYYEDDDEY